MKNTLTSLVLLFALSFVPAVADSVFSGAAGTAAAAVLSRDGQARMPVVVRADADEKIRALATTLAEYLGRLSGAEFTITDQAGAKGIMLGTAADFADLPSAVSFKAEPLHREDYVLLSSADALWVIGAEQLGAQHAVWDLLYRLGYRQFFPGAAWENLGQTVAAERTDSRCALSIGPDGNVYVAMRRVNDTGFGKGHLHHLVRYEPESGAMSDLGVLAVANPDYFDFKNAKTRSNGFRRLPDGTFAPDVVHLAMIISSKGDAFITFLYPFTVLHVKGVVPGAEYVP